MKDIRIKIEKQTSKVFPDGDILGISNENGTDLFINRIMFPLYDLEGKVVAFSGRIYNTKDSSKYINTKES